MTMIHHQKKSDDDNNSNDGYRHQLVTLPPRQPKTSQKTIISVDNYISRGTFGKVFSEMYDNHAVAWKICDAYKEKEKVAALKNEAHIYSVLESCQGIISCLFLFTSYLIHCY